MVTPQMPMTLMLMRRSIMKKTPYLPSTQVSIVHDQRSPTAIEDIAANYSSTANALANTPVVHSITQLPVKSGEFSHSPC
jgi:hypothetical protein